MNTRYTGAVAPRTHLALLVLSALSTPLQAQQWQWDTYGAGLYDGAVTLTDDQGLPVSSVSDPIGGTSPTAQTASQPPVIVLQPSTTANTPCAAVGDPCLFGPRDGVAIFTASSTFTPPEGVEQVYVVAVGGGGGGGNGGSAWQYGGGGGGSGFVKVATCSVSTPISVTVGGGGPPGANGGASSFGSCVTALGGGCGGHAGTAGCSVNGYAGGNGNLGGGGGAGFAGGGSGWQSAGGRGVVSWGGYTGIAGGHGVCGAKGGTSSRLSEGSTTTNGGGGGGGGYGGSGGAVLLGMDGTTPYPGGGGGGGYDCHPALTNRPCGGASGARGGCGYGAGGAGGSGTSWSGAWGAPGVVIVQW